MSDDPIDLSQASPADILENYRAKKMEEAGNVRTIYSIRLGVVITNVDTAPRYHINHLMAGERTRYTLCGEYISGYGGPYRDSDVYAIDDFSDIRERIQCAKCRALLSAYKADETIFPDADDILVTRLSL